MNKAVMMTAALMLALGLASAKIPPPVLDDAAKAKAAETAAKNAWQAKIDNYQLCKVQDKIAAAYSKSSGKAIPLAAKAASASAPASAVAAKPAASAAVAAAPPASTASGPAATTAATPAGTPVASAPPPPCLDPGPFAYNPPEQKPLETSGAHSPTGTAASPPSVRQESAQMAPAKAATASSKK